MDSADKNGFYKIGQVARELGVSVELIRAYENEGLLIPERTDKGQRKYKKEDVRWITCIRRLINEQGLNIEGIRRLLALMPCWECGPCTEEEKRTCPAFLGTAKPCWMIKDKLPESCRNENCRECKVYRNAIQCENLKRVLFQPETYLHNKK